MDVDNPPPAAKENPSPVSYIAEGELRSVYACPAVFCRLVNGVFCCLDGEYKENETPDNALPKQNGMRTPDSRATKTCGEDTHRPFWDCSYLRTSWKEDRNKWQGALDEIDDKTNIDVSEILYRTGCFEIGLAEMASISPYPSSDQDG